MQCHKDSNDKYHLTHWGRDKMAAIFPDGIFKYIFLNENIKISIKISLKFVQLTIFHHLSESESESGLDNGLAPTRWQTIICTNDG